MIPRAVFFFFFEKTKILINLSQAQEEKREWTQINKIRNERGEKTINTKEIQKILREYQEQLYENELDNLEEIEKFLEKYNLLKLKQEETKKNLNRTITSSEIEIVI